MSVLMNPIYNVISWVLLRWHWLWDAILPNGKFLGTTWDWVLAIVFLVITVRLVLFPIIIKQIKSQRAMQTLAPKMRELQAKHKGDPQTLREEVMKLYQTEKVNPLMGCLPLLLQAPVFFGLFHVLKYINPLGTAPKTLYGWTEAQFNSAAAAQLFTAPIPGAFNMDALRIAALGGAHASAAKVVAAVLVLIMMLTTFLTQRQMILKTGWQQEPQQRMIQKLMLYGVPVSLLLSGWAFPIGVIIYWVTQNIVTLLQQQFVLRKYPPVVTAQAPAQKSARERAIAAKTREPNALARFFLVLPPPAKPAGAAAVEKPGLLTRLTAVVRRDTAAAQPTVSKSAAEPAARSLAPRPGAKPRPTPSSRTSPVIDGEIVDGGVDGGVDGDEPPAPKRPAARPNPARGASPTQRPATASDAKTPVTKTPVTKTPVTKTAAAKPTAPATGAKPSRPVVASAAPKVVGSPSAKSSAPVNGSAPANGAANGSASANGAANGSAPATGGGATGTAGGASDRARPVARKATPAKSGARKSGQTGRKGSGRR